MRTLLRLGCVLAVAGLACSRADSTREEAGAAVPPAAGAAVETPAAATVADDWPRIVFLGDSLTAGYGLPVEAAVPALVQDRLVASGYPYAVVAHGVSGDTSAGGLSRLEYALEGDVAVLVVELGGNDGLRGLPVEGLERNLDAIITTAASRGIDVLLTGMEAPPNFGEAYTASFRQVYRDLADAHDVAFVPFYLEGVAGIPELNLGDGIHPNAEGSRIILETIWTALEPMLDRPAVSQETSGQEHAAR
jgi:acyl-CoA thioesterase-1